MIFKKGEEKQSAILFNKLARERFKLKLLEDIKIDMTICEMEGWDKKQYILELKQLLDDFYVKFKKRPKNHK